MASSKSAMNTLAPELSALITILRSTGPVISTRRSARSAGRRCDLPVAVADVGGLGQEVGHLAGVDPCAAAPARAASKFLAAGVEAAVQVGDELRAPPS